MTLLMKLSTVVITNSQGTPISFGALLSRKTIVMPRDVWIAESGMQATVNCVLIDKPDPCEYFHLTRPVPKNLIISRGHNTIEIEVSCFSIEQYSQLGYFLSFCACTSFKKTASGRHENICL